MWTCPKCESKVDPSFEVCWNCGTARDGTVDPTFVRADDAGPIETEVDPVTPALDVVPDVEVQGELPEPLQGELVEAYVAFDAVEAKFLADQLNEQSIQAVSDTHDLYHSLGGMHSGPRVWVRADDLPRARAWFESYDRSKAERVED